jgi:hypothetical protein
MSDAKISREDAQAEIGGLLVAEICNDFGINFSKVYPPHILARGVGPEQSFIGLAIKRGHLVVRDPAVLAELPEVKAMVDDPLQDGVTKWMIACFGPDISADRLERGDRLLEEVFELLQSGAYPRERISALEEYVWARDIGEPHQEVGGVMITLAAYCGAMSLDMHKAGSDELARIWTKIEKIRAKQAAKPTGSALPQAVRNKAFTEAEVRAHVAAEVRKALEGAAAFIQSAEAPIFDYSDGPKAMADTIKVARVCAAAILAHIPAGFAFGKVVG